jgi:hypothetical protein
MFDQLRVNERQAACSVISLTQVRRRLSHYYLQRRPHTRFAEMPGHCVAVRLSDDDVQVQGWFALR